MDREDPSRREYVLRALAATEIAETCNEPRLRASFFELAESWLDRAEHFDDGLTVGSSVH